MVSASQDDTQGPTLEHLVEALGPAILRVLSTPGLALVRARDVVVYDAADPPTLQPADIVLAVGLLNDAERTCHLIRSAGEAGSAAIVLKSCHVEEARLRETAECTNVTLIALPAGMQWAQIAVLLRHAMSSAAVGVSGLTQVGDLFGFANVLAGAAGGAVTIEDANSQVLAYSTVGENELDEPRRQAILGRRVPEPYLEHLRDHGVLRDLQLSNEVVPMEPSAELGLRRRLAISVRAGGELLGTLWVLEGAKPLGPESERALRDASHVAPAHLLRARSAGNVLWQRREDLLKQLLEGRADARTAGESLGFDPDLPASVLAIALDSTVTLAADHQAYRRLDELLKARAMAFRRHVASAVCGTRMLALLPELVGDGERIHVGVRRLAEGLASDAAQAGIQVRIACGPVTASLVDVAASCVVTDQVLEVLAAEPARGPVAAREDVRAAVALREVLEALSSAKSLWEGPVERLIAQDAAHGTDYEQTLRVWLDEFGDVGRASRRLNVHSNTFRYRLQRISQLTGMRLDDPAERLMAALHLRHLEHRQRASL